MNEKIKPINENIIEYRGVQFEYHEWITFDGNQATGYHCDCLLYTSPSPRD